MNILHRSLSAAALTILVLNIFTPITVIYASPEDADITAPLVEGSIVVDGILDEEAWMETDAIEVNLSPSNAYGGHIQKVKVKTIHNGSWIFIAAEWSDPSEDRWEMPRIRLSPGQFLHNETYHYSDQFIVGWWFDDGPPTEEPWANTQYAGTTRGRVPWTGGRGSLWVWRGYQSDEDSPFWPKPYFDPRTYRWGPRAGEPLIYPHPHAYETLLNATANFVIGSYITHIRACAYPEKETYPFDVWARGRWSGGGWVLEMGRPFTPNELNTGLTMEFEDGGTYYLFFAAYDGFNGEIEDTGSISGWKTLYLTPKSSQGITTPTILLPTIAAVAIVVLIAAALYRRGRSTPD